MQVQVLTAQRQRRNYYVELALTLTKGSTKWFSNFLRFAHTYVYFWTVFVIFEQSFVVFVKCWALDKIMLGELDELIQAMIEFDRQERLKGGDE